MGETAEILLLLYLLNLIGALISRSALPTRAYANLTHDSFISGVVEMKLNVPMSFQSWV